MAKEIDFDSIKTMSIEQQQQVYYTLSKRANQRFRDLAKAGYKSGAGAKTQRYLQDVYGRNTFKQSKKLQGIDLKEGLKALETFYKAKTSTAKGIKQLEKKHIQIMKDKGINITDKKKFFDFISSQQFKTLSKYADSDQIVKDFTNAFDEGFSVESIMQGYDEFLNNDLTFEQVAERRNNISDSELLH